MTDTQSISGERPRRVYSAVALLLIGSGLSLVAAAILGGSMGKTIDGFALLAIAALLGMYAIRGGWKHVPAVVVSACGLCIWGVGFSNAGGRANWAVAAGSAALLSAGALMVRRAKSWPSMSTRYEREARSATRTPTAWEAIDRGEDPTA